MGLIFHRAGFTGILCLAACGIAAAIAQDSVPRGEIVDRVLCMKDPDQSYALYLPAAYSPQKPLPILYCFDPGGRGRVPVELFHEAAERLNYIVVGSHNSRNGPWAPNLVAIQALLRDTQARFALDRRRFYTAGMSGGGGPAWQVAVAGAAGTIICASAIDIPEKDLKSVSFSLFGVAGMADFNFEYIFKQVAAFRNAGKAARFETFEGGHSWPPQDLAAAALDWLEIQAIRNGLRESDPDFVKRQFQEATARAERLESAGALPQTHRAYDDLVRDFDGLRNVDACRAKALQLGGLRQVTEARKQELEIARAQNLALRNLFEAKSILESPASQASPTADIQQALTDAEIEITHSISVLKQRMKKPLPEPQRIIAQRVLEEFYIQMTTHSRELMQAKRYALAITNYRLCLEIRPGSPGILFELARAYAGRKDKKRALEYLSKAVDAGYRGGEEIRNSTEMENLRREKRFVEILSRIESSR
jgi:tetratricopeptide (TPR) repeat protein